MKKKKYALIAVLIGIVIMFSVGQITKREEIPEGVAAVIAEAEGVSANMEYVIHGRSAEEIDLAIAGTLNYFNRLMLFADVVQVDGLDKEEADAMTAFLPTLQQKYNSVQHIFERYDQKGQMTEEEREFLESVKDAFDSFLSAMPQRD